MRIKTKLFEHQQNAVKKITPLSVGALFMEMGTGKSLTAISLAKIWNVKNVVWFCPVSLKETVLQEIRKHVSWSRPYVFNHKTNVKNLPQHFWTIIGIESMSSSVRQVVAAKKLVNKNTLVIVDESSYIKGHRSWRTLRITDIGKQAKYRLILTGTPMSQGVQDLFAQMGFLDKNILGYSSWYTFSREHLIYSDRYPGLIVRSHNTAYLADKIAPWIYQVTKKECIDLPPKLYKTVYYEMSHEQRESYEQAKYEILGSLLDNNSEINSYVIFQLFSALQQIISGYWKKELTNSRIHTLFEFLDTIHTQTIIWCKYIRSVEKIANHLGDKASLFYGKLNEKRRNEEIQKFKKGLTQYLVATTSCGGYGLNLTEATNVIYYESTFKYSERLQSEDRCHRIGQDKNVLYTDFICHNSIDERIAQSLSKKQNVVSDFKSKLDSVKDDPAAMQKLIIGV